MCGVLGYSGTPISLDFAKDMLQLLVHRGQDACGLTWIDEYGVHRESKLKGFPKNIHITKSAVSHILGSTRYPTYGLRTGDVDVHKFAQPFSFQTRFGTLSLCHNGQITNLETLTGNKFHGDAEFIVTKLGSLIEEYGDLKESVDQLMKELDGSYAVVGFLGNTLFAFRDPRGIRPLIVGLGEFGVVVSSESLLLQNLKPSKIFDIKPGQLMIYPNREELSFYQLIKKPTHQICMFEFVYFASAASTIDGQNVYAARLNLGSQLAKLIQEKHLSLDQITPVPDTSKTAATKISEQLSIPLREAILKNRTSNRTFITPNKEQRDLAAKNKYLYLDDYIRGKNILLVDDSIVRGTTMRRLIGELRLRGVNEVHIAITNLATKYPCYYGIDFATKNELIAVDKTESEICNELNANSLTYLTLEGLIGSINVPGLCTACITGKYPTIYGAELHNLVESGYLSDESTHYEKRHFTPLEVTK